MTVTHSLEIPGTPISVDAGWPTFTSVDITSGLLALWDYSSLSTAEGQPISSVPSFGSWNASLTTPYGDAFRPTMARTGIAGKPAARFTSSANNVQRVSLPATLNFPYTIAITIKRADLGANQHVVSGSLVGGTARGPGIAVNNNAATYMWAGGDTVTQLTANGTSGSTSEVYVLVGTFAAGTNASTFYSNGAALKGTTGSGSNATLVPTDMLHVGANRNGALSYFNGWISEVRIYGRVLSADDVQALTDTIRLVKLGLPS